MTGDQWRVVDRVVVYHGRTLQLCVIRDGKSIPVGPWADTIEEMKVTCGEMLAACDLPVLNESEAPVI